MLLAGTNDSRDAMEYLLSRSHAQNEFLNAQDAKGRTALMHSFSKGNYDAVTYLIHHPAIDVMLRDRQGVSLLGYVFNCAIGGWEDWTGWARTVIEHVEWPKSIIRRAVLSALQGSRLDEVVHLLLHAPQVINAFCWDINDLEIDTILLLVLAGPPCNASLQIRRVVLHYCGALSDRYSEDCFGPGICPLRACRMRA